MSDVSPVYTSVKVGPRAYAMRVVGDSMENSTGKRPTYPSGSIIIVDPDISPISGCVVIVKIQGTRHAALRLLIEEHGEKWLKPLNSKYSISRFTEKDKIEGVIRQTIINEDDR